MVKKNLILFGPLLVGLMVGGIVLLSIWQPEKKSEQQKGEALALESDVGVPEAETPHSTANSSATQGKFVFKTLYPGMPVDQIVTWFNEHNPWPNTTYLKEKVMVAGSEMFVVYNSQEGKPERMMPPDFWSVSGRAMATLDGKVQMIEIVEPILSTVFNTKDLKILEFAHLFAESYHLPPFEFLQETPSGWVYARQYHSDAGFEVLLAAQKSCGCEKRMVVYDRIATEQRSFN